MISGENQFLSPVDFSVGECFLVPRRGEDGREGPQVFPGLFLPLLPPASGQAGEGGIQMVQDKPRPWGLGCQSPGATGEEGPALGKTSRGARSILGEVPRSWWRDDH